ncbi:MAG TPA: DUF192 domain-containing protein, partial [Thermomicrobiales bacterium]|nr:DUF192 domain-containing protein [Thermomicrobiales bacterium]
MRTLSRVVAIVILAVTLTSPIALAQRQPVPPWREPLPPARSTAEIVVGETTVPVELAIARDEQTLGLGYRNSLDPDAGMLFVFEEASPRTFWMMGMRFCLDIIWVTGNEIVGAAESVCPPPAGTDASDYPSYPSDEPVTHVLEVNAGWLEAHGYGPGTPVE